MRALRGSARRETGRRRPTTEATVSGASPRTYSSSEAPLHRHHRPSPRCSRGRSCDCPRRGARRMTRAALSVPAPGPPREPCGGRSIPTSFDGRKGRTALPPFPATHRVRSGLHRRDHEPPAPVPCDPRRRRTARANGSRRTVPPCCPGHWHAATVDPTCPGLFTTCPGRFYIGSARRKGPAEPARVVPGPRGERRGGGRREEEGQQRRTRARQARGREGGRARARALSPAERSEIARRAVRARWAKSGKVLTTPVRGADPGGSRCHARCSVDRSPSGASSSRDMS